MTQPRAIRFSDELLVRMDRIAEVMSERAAGAHLSRSHAIRAAIERGAAVLETELGIVKPKRAKKR
jgi:predicted transcriptional regulator